MKKRIVMKKGRKVVTRRGGVVLHLANFIYDSLKPLSKKIEIAGSIRRKSKTPVDIDIVLIPKNKERIFRFLEEKGKFLQGGEKRLTFRIRGVKVEIYFATEKSFGAALLAYTGPQGASIGLRTIAKKKGMLLNQYGLFKNKKYLVGKTEREIYHALGKKWKAPHLR